MFDTWVTNVWAKTWGILWIGIRAIRDKRNRMGGKGSSVEETTHAKEIPKKA